MNENDQMEIQIAEINTGKQKIIEEDAKEQNRFIGKMINLVETMYLRGYKDSLVDIFEELKKK